MTTAIAKLTSDFIAQLEAYVVERVNTRLSDVLAIGMIKLPGRVPAYPRTPEEIAKFNGPLPVKARRKAPIQLCPAPRCRNRAAPIFRMVCAGHKGTPLKVVHAWREARRARKARAS